MIITKRLKILLYVVSYLFMLFIVCLISYYITKNNLACISTSSGRLVSSNDNTTSQVDAHIISESCFLYGSTERYNPEVVYGLLKKGDKFLLLHPNVFTDQYANPIICIIVISGVHSNSKGWIRLSETNLFDYYVKFVEKPDYVY